MPAVPAVPAVAVGSGLPFAPESAIKPPQGAGPTGGTIVRRRRRPANVTRKGSASPAPSPYHTRPSVTLRKN